MKNSIVIMAVSLIMIFGACGESENTKKKKAKNEPILKFDTDQDGRISFEEWMSPRRSKFSELDSDTDGLIQKKEWKSKKKAHNGRKFRKIDTDDDKQITMIEWLTPIQNSFQMQDTSQDGFITKDELKSKKADRKRKDKIDKNNDGKISYEEFIADKTNSFGNIDKDNDGFISRKELKATGKSGYHDKFRNIDANKDKKVTESEWLDPHKKKFQKRDENKDGFITEDEKKIKQKK